VSRFKRGRRGSVRKNDRVRLSPSSRSRKYVYNKYNNKYECDSDIDSDGPTECLWCGAHDHMREDCKERLEEEAKEAKMELASVRITPSLLLNRSRYSFAPSPFPESIPPPLHHPARKKAVTETETKTSSSTTSTTARSEREDVIDDVSRVMGGNVEKHETPLELIQLRLDSEKYESPESVKIELKSVVTFFSVLFFSVVYVFFSFVPGMHSFVSVLIVGCMYVLLIRSIMSEEMMKKFSKYDPP